MSDRTQRSDLTTSSGAYVLNALDPNEQNEFEAQLAGSEELRNEVTELTDTAVLLGMAVTPVAPSAELRANIMSRLATTPQLSRDVAPIRTIHAAHRAEASESVDGASQQDAPPTALGRKTQARWFQRPLSMAAAAVAAVLVVAGASFGIGQAVTPHSPTISNVAADQLAAIEGASDQQRSDAKVPTGGTVTLVWSASLGKSALLTKNLKALPSDKVYQLWYINSSGKPVSAGLLTGTWKVLDGKLTSGDTIGMTVEPKGGSTSPSTTPVVAIASA